MALMKENQRRIDSLSQDVLWNQEKIDELTSEIKVIKGLISNQIGLGVYIDRLVSAILTHAQVLAPFQNWMCHEVHGLYQWYTLGGRDPQSEEDEAD
jgi:hypothetical protein